MNTAERLTPISTTPRQREQLETLATALLVAPGLDDVLELLPGAFADALGSGYQARVALGRDGATLAPASARAADLACIPLTWQGELLGAIFIAGDGRDDAATSLDSPTLGSLQRLFSAAIAARGRMADEHARQITEASQLRFDVVSMLSHEMRTPLAAIKGYVSALLLDDVEWESAVRVEFLQTIEAETDHMTALVTDVLESTALDAGELRIEVEAVRVPEIVKRVVGKLSIQTDSHRFVVSFPPDFPDIAADPGRIEQVLTNLIDNAIKYSPDGGLVMIRGEVRPDEVVVSVIDQGIGIAPEDLNKLFERFFRASPDRRGRIGGAGLGLPIADSIIRTHGGRIWAESAIGNGTTLSFALPTSAENPAR